MFPLRSELAMTFTVSFPRLMGGSERVPAWMSGRTILILAPSASNFRAHWFPVSNSPR
jgi:hypothetical protein